MKKNITIIIVSLIVFAVLVILPVFILYSAYSNRTKITTTPVLVPYALEQISSGTKITKSMIGTREVPPSMISRDVITDENEIIDKYVIDDSIIEKGSLFYKSDLILK